jgi:hypothetical protein
VERAGSGVDAVAQVVNETSYPDRQSWADEYLRSVNSDADALRALGTSRRSLRLNTRCSAAT